MFEVIGSAALIPVSLVSAPLLLSTMFFLGLGNPVLVSDVDYSFERLRQEQVAKQAFGVFRTNGGATTSFGIVVRRERVIIPGLLAVKEICSCYPADDVRLMRVNAHTLRCAFPAYSPDEPGTRQVDVDDEAG
jgi:hypothetical protein